MPYTTLVIYRFKCNRCWIRLVRHCRLCTFFHTLFLTIDSLINHVHRRIDHILNQINFIPSSNPCNMIIFCYSNSNVWSWKTWWQGKAALLMMWYRLWKWCILNVVLEYNWCYSVPWLIHILLVIKVTSISFSHGILKHQYAVKWLLIHSISSSRWFHESLEIKLTAYVNAECHLPGIIQSIEWTLILNSTYPLIICLNAFLYFQQYPNIPWHDIFIFA